MNRPENEMLFIVMEKHIAQNGKTYWNGYLGINGITASENADGTLFIRLQKWPKEKQHSVPPKGESHHGYYHEVKDDEVSV